MGTARSGVAAAALDGLLYVMGGWDGVNRLRTGEVVHTHFLFISTLMDRCTTQPPTGGRACPR